MPASIRESERDGGAQSELVAECGQRVVGKCGVGGAGELEGIDPWSEAVAWESAEEAFFGPHAVGDDDMLMEVAAQGGPELLEAGGVGEVGILDPVDFAGGPGDGGVGGEVADERIVVADGDGPACEPELDRDVGFPRAGTGGLEVDGAEAELVDGGGGGHPWR